MTTHLRTTVPEIERYVKGRGAIGDYLTEIFKDYQEDKDQVAWSKIIWDIVTIGYLIDDEWVPSDIVHSPILTDRLTWSFDNARHFIRCANYVRRNPIFGDLFTKLETRKSKAE